MDRRIIYLLLFLLFCSTSHAGVCVLGGSGTSETVTACETQTTPNDMETSASEYFWIASASTNKYASSKFVADATTGTVCRICLSLNKVQSPTMNFSVQIWSDSGGHPNAMLSNYGSMNAANIAGTFGDCFSLGSAALANGTTYHVVIVADAYSATDYFRWVKDSTCTTKSMQIDADGTSFTETVTTQCGMVKLYTVAP